MRWMPPLYAKIISCESKRFSCLFSNSIPMCCPFVKKLIVFSQNINSKVNEYLNLLEKKLCAVRVVLLQFASRFVACFHDDVIKWKHFSRYWPFVRGIHRCPVNSSHKGQWRRVLMFSLMCAWTNGVNNRDAGHLRCRHAHYDVTILWGPLSLFHISQSLLTLWGQVTDMCISKPGHHCFRKKLFSGKPLSEGMLVCFNLTLGDIFQWNFNQTETILYKKMSFRMSSVKWQPFYLGLNLLQ